MKLSGLKGLETRASPPRVERVGAARLHPRGSQRSPPQQQRSQRSMASDYGPLGFQGRLMTTDPLNEPVPMTSKASP